MGRFVRGDIVVVPFPFSDLSKAKKRPALIIAELAGNELILCQITSRQVHDSYSLPLNEGDFLTGGLRKPSNIRPNRLFTADAGIILYKAGGLTQTKVEGVVSIIAGILRGGSP